MDRFDLNWPKTDAVFYTDGWRCRIVWRQKGGIGGTIDNNVQCVQRVAQSLEGAPYLLNALKARGHARLATQIESVAEVPVAEEQSRTETVNRPAAKPARKVEKRHAAEKERSERRSAAPAAVDVTKAKPVPVLKKPAGGEIGAAWLERLNGSADFELADNRRAKVWTELGTLFDEILFLKAPAPKGKQEWVLKRTWSDAKRKAEYVAAPSFRGIAAYLVGVGASGAFIEALFGACKGLGQDELKEAASAWRSLQKAATH